MAAARPTLSSLSAEPTKFSIRDRVYTILRERMHRGEIAHEDRLVDHEIAAALNVSRMPVREALLQLKSEGYLEGTSRGFVLPRFTPEDIANIFEVRLLLEPAAAASACEHATVEGLGKMTAAVASAERAHKKADALLYMQANWSFRSAWVGMVSNPYLAQTINRLHDHAQAVRLATLKEKTFRGLSLEHTKAILDAFVRGDADAVRDRVTRNLKASAASYYAKQGDLQGGDDAAPAGDSARPRRTAS